MKRVLAAVAGAVLLAAPLVAHAQHHGGRGGWGGGGWGGGEHGGGSGGGRAGGWGGGGHGGGGDRHAGWNGSGAAWRGGSGGHGGAWRGRRAAYPRYWAYGGWPYYGLVGFDLGFAYGLYPDDWYDPLWGPYVNSWAVSLPPPAYAEAYPPPPPPGARPEPPAPEPPGAEAPAACGSWRWDTAGGRYVWAPAPCGPGAPS